MFNCLWSEFLQANIARDKIKGPSPRSLTAAFEAAARNLSASTIKEREAASIGIDQHSESENHGWPARDVEDIDATVGVDPDGPVDGVLFLHGSIFFSVSFLTH